MESHDVARPTEPRSEQQRLKDLQRIRDYRQLEDQFRTQVVQRDLGAATLDITSKILRINPEYYTVWNVRRACLISTSLSVRLSGPSPSKASQSSSANATPLQSVVVPSSSSLEGTQQSPSSPLIGQNGSPAERSSGCHASATTDGDASSLLNRQQQQDETILRAELAFTKPLLMKSPKCYWLWKYRLWILNQSIKRLSKDAATVIWQEELALVSKMLHLDRRNFHAWGYRRQVVGRLEGPVLCNESMTEPEFEYTTKKIRDDLSNFSAWHSRSKLIPKLLQERHADEAARRQLFESELATVQEGLNVGPEDQSLWYYHQFLVSTLVDRNNVSSIAPQLTLAERLAYVENEIEQIKDLQEDYPDVKWLYQALIDDTRALCELGSRKLEGKEVEQVKDWLHTLKRLDPMRLGRWQDIETELGLV